DLLFFLPGVAHKGLHELTLEWRRAAGSLGLSARGSFVRAIHTVRPGRARSYAATDGTHQLGAPAGRGQERCDAIMGRARRRSDARCGYLRARARGGGTESGEACRAPVEKR